MSKFYLDILFALSISIIANIITPYLQNLLHIHAINAAHRKNRRIAALHRLAQMPSREFSGESAGGSARGSIDATIDGLIDGTIDRSIDGPIHGPIHGSVLGLLNRSGHDSSHPVMARKYRIEGFVLATGALIWSLLRSGLNPKTNAVGSLVFLVSAMAFLAAELTLRRR